MFLLGSKRADFFILMLVKFLNNDLGKNSLWIKFADDTQIGGLFNKRCVND